MKRLLAVLIVLAVLGLGSTASAHWGHGYAVVAVPVVAYPTTYVAAYSPYVAYAPPVVYPAPVYAAPVVPYYAYPAVAVPVRVAYPHHAYYYGW